MSSEVLNFQEFWNEIGFNKNFNDPFFIDRLSPWLSKDKQIIEYGCGYGRILNILWEHGYKKTIGFDFASKMLERGHVSFPYLNLQLIKHLNKIPLPDQSVDIAVLSTVLCSNPYKRDQKKIIKEIQRVLKKEGIFYFCDFLITPSGTYWPRYLEHSHLGQKSFGLYKTSTGILVRHHHIHWILDLLKDFDTLWLEQMNGITTGNNSVRTVHLIAQRL